MPDFKDETSRRLAAMGLPAEREAEVIDELSQHLEDRYEELRARGITAEEAREAVLLELGRGGELLAELRAVEGAAPGSVALGAPRRGNALGVLARDLRHGLRALRLRPGFTAVAVATLALGIGASTAIFSLVHGVLLSPLPFAQPERLVTFWMSAPSKGLPEIHLTQALFAYLGGHHRSFEALAAYSATGFTLTGSEEPERLRGTNVSEAFFRVLGARPLHGRTFLPEEDTPGRNLVAVLSHGLWQRRFGGDPAVVGKSIVLDGIPTVVVGVMPASFEFPAESELWVPVGIDPERFNYWYLETVGRLRPGLDARAVQDEVAALADGFKRRHPEHFPEAKGEPSTAVAMPLAASIVGAHRAPLFLLLAATGLLLLIACANIAHLLLARATAQGRELAMRSCLGASRRRIICQLATENVLLALAGAALGVVLAAWWIEALKRLAAGSIPRVDQAGLSPTVLLFAVAVTLLAALLFGLAPALRLSQTSPREALEDGGRGGASARHRRLTSAFVVSQLALSLVLLVGAGLLLRSFQRLRAVDPGFRPENVLMARLELPDSRYADDDAVRGFYGPLLDQVRALPGVRAAGLTQRAPFSSRNFQDEFIVEGQEPRPGEPIPVANLRVVSTGYLEAIGTPILAGRPFAELDDAAAPPVAIVDDKLARQYWPAQSALGRRLRLGGDPGRNPWMTVVGVVASVKHSGLDETADLCLYRPLAQRPWWDAYLVVRTAGAPAALGGTLRREVARLDPGLPLFEVRTLEEAVAASLAARRLTDLLLAAFALVALLLAAVGIFGVMSLEVGGRRREFGIRLALGARSGEVLRLVLAQGMRLALGGLALGLAAAAALARLLESQLYGVAPLDPLTFATVSAVLACVALLACYLPARQATQADPIAALRAE